MNNELFVLTITALSIGFFHTLFGPDHYVPFIVMSKARNWSTGKTAWITFLCGVGHVGSSVILGLAGIALGIAVSHLQFIESVRGNIAAWFLMAFGLVYMIWGLRKAYRNRPHTHTHFHSDGTSHSHNHTHHHSHSHLHSTEARVNLTPWILFTIFIFGPCEPLIPILMYPAAYHSMGSLLWIVFVFSTVTIGTMITVVLLMRYGFQLIPMTILERFTHAMAGAAILMCGVAIQFLGL
jgi:nickel/cobalt transporter (NicO) family protein